MRKIVNYLLLLTALIVYGPSCKKDVDIEKPVIPADLDLVDAKVVLPAGNSYNLSGHELLHHAKSLPVTQDGTTSVIKPKGDVSIAYVFNKEGKPVMAGFVTDSTSTISIESTAKVILYFAMGIPQLEDTLTHIYINRVHEVPEINEWVNDFTNAWKADPLTFHTGTYRAKLRSWLENKQKVLPPAGLRVGSINVNSTDVRSGLRLNPTGFGLSFTNTYRRRATAVFYKMKRKLVGSDTYTPILTSIGRDTDHDSFLSIDPVSGVTSVVGEVWKQLTDRGTESFAVTSGPANFDLADNEQEAVYKARVVGLGNVDPSKLTKKEEEEYLLLFARTFAVDILGPAVGCAVGAVNTYAFFNDDIVNILMVDLPKIVPGLIENVLLGDYKKVFTGALDGLASEHGFELLMKYVKSTYDPADIPIDFEKQVKRGALILQAMDMALLGADFVRIATDSDISKGLEEWEFTVRAGKVNVTPAESVLSIFAPSNKEDIEAIVQNITEDEAKKVSYEWTLYGKYASIADSKGNTGLSFITTEKKISVTAKNDPGLTDGDNWQTIIVKAFLDNKEIGVDTARVNVKKSRYQISPDGATVSGKLGSTNKVNLRLQPYNNGTPIAPNNDFDFKVIWETGGSYGGLEKASGANATNITTYNDAKMLYECVDDKVRTATETVTARIFAKKKGLPDSDYRLMDFIKASIKISNDEKKQIMHVPLTCSHGDTIRQNVSITCMITTYASFKEVKDAKSYSVRFYDVRWPATYSWNAGAAIPGTPPSYVVKPSAGTINVAYGSSWAVGAVQLVTHFTCAQSGGGMAEVTVTLK